MHGTDPRGYLSDAFLDRVRRAYQLALGAGSGPTGGMWNEIFRRQEPIHAALVAEGNAAIRNIFSDPIATDFFYGADNFGTEEQEASHLLTVLRQFTDEEIDFPNPFPNESGVRTNRGTASYRAIQSAYQAWRVRALVGAKTQPSVVEIGPGVGRVIYYLFQSRIDCTTIDLPIGMIAQACFLGATLGPETLWLPGDAENLMQGRVKLLFASSELPNRRYDLVLNADSLTELRWYTALRYGRWINQHADIFLSINHQGNYIRVEEIARASFNTTGHEWQQYPLRPGYVEEVFFLRGGPTRRRTGAFIGLCALVAKAWLRRARAHLDRANV